MLEKLFKISLGLLIGLGGQYLIVSFATLKTLDFSGFNPFMWIMQTLYVIFIITLTLKEN